jgi:hypothetical protein
MSRPSRRVLNQPLPISAPASRVRTTQRLGKALDQETSRVVERTLFPPPPPNLYDHRAEPVDQMVVIPRTTAKAIVNLLMKYRTKMGEQRAIDDILKDLS